MTSNTSDDVIMPRSRSCDLYLNNANTPGKLLFQEFFSWILHFNFNHDYAMHSFCSGQILKKECVAMFPILGY